VTVHFCVIFVTVYCCHGWHHLWSLSGHCVQSGLKERKCHRRTFKPEMSRFSSMLCVLSAFLSANRC